MVAACAYDITCCRMWYYDGMHTLVPGDQGIGELGNRGMWGREWGGGGIGVRRRGLGGGMNRGEVGEHFGSVATFQRVTSFQG